jgi:hypothetical protein
MHQKSRHLSMLAAIAAMMLPAAAAQAQYYYSASPPPASQPPLYPYAVQGGPSYAVQVSPNTYVIQRGQQAVAPAYPYVQSRHAKSAPKPKAEHDAKRFDHKPKPANRELIEELRQRAQAKRDKENHEQGAGKQDKRSIKIVRDKAVVVETKRYVDDPPRVIERNVVVEDEPTRAPRQRGLIQAPALSENIRRDDNKKRVIQADAEVTILGPDRMSIRLFRKGHGPKEAPIEALKPGVNED